MDVLLCYEMGQELLTSLNIKTEFYIAQMDFLGVCNFDKDMNPISIGLSKAFVSLNTPIMVTDTILHEVGHYTSRDISHEKKWEDEYLSLGGMGVSNANRLTVFAGPTWSAICPNCGALSRTEVDLVICDFTVCCCRCAMPIVFDHWVEPMKQTMNVCGTSNQSSYEAPPTQTGRRLLELAIDQESRK